MTTKTYTNTANFSPLAHGSAEAGSFVPSLSNFDAAPASTLLNDFTLINTGNANSMTVTGGVFRIDATGLESRISSVAPRYTAPTAKIDNAVDGDFDVQVEIAAFNGDDNFEGAALAYYIDDDNYMMIRRVYNSGQIVQMFGVVGGSLVNVGTGIFSPTSCFLRLTRSTNTFTGYYKENEGDAWTALGTNLAALAAVGDIGMGVCTFNTTNALVVDFDNLQFNSGFALEATTLINDSGAFVIDAGLGNIPDMSTLTVATSGSSTVLLQYAAKPSTVAGTDAATVDSNLAGDWNGTWLTPAQFRGETDPEAGNQYLYLKAQVTGDVADTLDQITIDVYASDLVAPTAPENVAAYKDDDASTLDVFLKFTGGTDSGGSGYAGTNIAYYDTSDSTWYYQQSDESFAASESFDSLNLVGTEGAEVLSTIQDLPGTVTRIRLTCWDNAGNNSARSDHDLVDVGDTAAPATAMPITDAGTGTTWEVVTTTTEPDAAVHLYNDADDSLVAILDTNAETADLTAGDELYCKIGAAGKALSTRFPAVGGVTVPPITAPSGPDVPTVTWADNTDGTGAVVEVTACTDGAVNTVYTRLLGASTWTNQGTISGVGTKALALSEGTYWGYVESTTAGGCSSSAPVKFYVTNTTAGAIMKQLRDGVAALLNDATFAVDVSITSGYLAYHNLETETGTVNILVAPGQVDIDSESGGYSDDIRDLAINIAVQRRATTDAEADECLKVAETIYDTLHNQSINGSRNTTKQQALTYDEDYLRENEQFRGVMRFFFRRTA